MTVTDTASIANLITIKPRKVLYYAPSAGEVNAWEARKGSPYEGPLVLAGAVDEGSWKPWSW